MSPTPIFKTLDEAKGWLGKGEVLRRINSYEALMAAVWAAPHTSTCEFNTNVGYKSECSCWKGEAIAQAEAGGKA